MSSRARALQIDQLARRRAQGKRAQEESVLEQAVTTETFTEYLPYKAGTDTIANGASTQAVAFASAFDDANYSIALGGSLDEAVWPASKTASGFTLTRTGTVGAHAVDWIAIPHRDP